MASALNNLSQYDPASVPSAANMRFAIVVSDYNTDITYALLKGCCETLIKHGAAADNIYRSHVPGAYELPLGGQIAYDQTKADAVICIGCVITGETKHDDYINQSVAQGIMQLNLKHTVPFVFGLLTPRTHEQALARAGGKHGNKGVEIAIAAIKMVDLKAGE